MRRSLIIFSLNMLANSQSLLPFLPLEEFDEVLVIDGGSNDGSVKFFLDNGIEVKGQKVGNYSEAMAMGANNTSGEVMVFYKPDGREDPRDIMRLVKCLEDGADVAIASRFAVGSLLREDGAVGLLRNWLNKGFTLAANFLFRRGPYVTDTVNSFRAVRREMFEMLQLDAPCPAIAYQMSIRAMKMRADIREVPTAAGDCAEDKTLNSLLSMSWDCLKVLMRETLGIMVRV